MKNRSELCPAWLLALFLILFSLNGSFAVNSPPEKVVIVGPLSVTNVSEEGDLVALDWNRVDRALWYNVYLQKDGRLFRNQWYRADEISSAVLLVSSDYPPGSYRWWVRAWEPSSGSGEWSESGAFTVECRNLLPPALQFPADNVTIDGYWLGALAVQRVPSVTWAEIELTRNGIFYSREWVQFPSQSNSTTLAANDPSGFNLVLPDGTYEWRARVWSPCHGPSQFSPARTFIQQNSNCTGPSAEPWVINLNRLHFTSYDFTASNHPSVNPQYTELTSYSQFYLRSVSTGRVLFNRWLYHTDMFADFVPALKPGDYELWVRGYNECGIGAWTEAPLVISITEKTATGVESFAFRGHSCEGYPHVAWGIQPGIDWYQLYLEQEGRVVLNQWFDMSGSGPFEGIKIDDNEGLSGSPRTNRLYFDFEIPTAGRDLNFWVRTYDYSGRFGTWTQLVIPQQFSDVGSPNISPIPTNNGVPTIQWSETNSIGRYHFWLTRNGQYYFDSYVECSGGVADNRGEGWPEIAGTLDTEWTPFFTLSPGNYAFYVRNVCGNYATPWSGPENFTVVAPAP